MALVIFSIPDDFTINGWKLIQIKWSKKEKIPYVHISFGSIRCTSWISPHPPFTWAFNLTSSITISLVDHELATIFFFQNSLYCPCSYCWEKHNSLNMNKDSFVKKQRQNYLTKNFKNKILNFKQIQIIFFLNFYKLFTKI